MLLLQMLGGDRRLLVYVAAAVIVLLGCMSSRQLALGAETYNVGDGGGWTTNTDYSQWAHQYTFREGDTIVFLYSRGSHDVLRVNQRDYLTCSASSPIETDASGETAFQLRAGGYYFICGFPEHCQHHQKVYVKVLPPVGSTLPDPHPSAGGNLPAYTQSAEGPVASLPVPIAVPSAASGPQRSPTLAMLIIFTALSSPSTIMALRFICASGLDLIQRTVR